jgi:Ca2+-binding RTX toxin-like protein
MGMAIPIRRIQMTRRTKGLATVGAALAASLAMAPHPAEAAVSSASIAGQVATLNLDGASDTETVSVAGGLLVHTASAGLNSADWDSARGGDQTVPADGTFHVVVNGGIGDDAITVLAKDTEIIDATLNGEAGDDVLTGADSKDTLNGGDGNDRLAGALGADTMNGGAGNDTLVWNNRDGSDVVNGDAGNDVTEVNGAPNAGDAITLAPNSGRVKLQRTNLVAFTLDTSTERFQVNGLGGNDVISAAPGVGALTSLSVDGGAGDDMASGSEAADLISGGEGNDVLSGQGGDDRIVGDRGADTMSGGGGDDTAVWNNGDGTDVVEGDDGRDDVEVNGAPGAGDAFTVQRNGVRIRFDRTNLVPFSIDIGSSETLHANGLGGDDAISVSDVGGFEVTGSGGSGNDTLTGGGGSETFTGGSGSDTITPGGGLDVVSGDDGDDHVNIRDGASDVARGGAGTDSVVADGPNLDVLDGFESVDRRNVAAPPRAGRGAHRLIIGRATVKVRKGIAAVRVSNPAGSGSRNAGTLTIRTAHSVRVGGLRAVLQLGSRHYSVAPGTTRTVRVRLSNGIRRLDDRRGHIAARAVATTNAAGTIATSSRSVTLALR